MSNKKKIKDELNLIDLFILIWNGKWKILSITIVITIFAYFYNSLRQTHESEFLLEIKSKNEIENLMFDKFNAFGVYKLSHKNLFQEYLDELENFSTLFLFKESNNENKSIAELSSNKNYNTIINSIKSLIKINPSIYNFAINQNGLNDVSTISFTYKDANKAKNIIYSLHSLINQNVIKEIDKKFRNVMKTMSEEKNMEVELLNLKISTIKEKYNQIYLNRLTFLNEQINIMNNFGLSKPVPRAKFLEEDEFPNFLTEGYKILEKELIDVEINKNYNVLKHNFIKSQIEREFDLIFKNNSNFSTASVAFKIIEPKKLNNKFNLIVIIVCGITIGLMHVLLSNNFLKLLKTRLKKNK
jgi:LPS O-antigen subunit length determinant protein (WzzB/FepE family)